MKIPRTIILPDISEIKDLATKEALKQFSNLIEENHRYYYENARLSVITIPDGDTTPDVQDGMVFKTANTGATTITTFDNGFVGQKIALILGDANTSIATTDNIILKSAYTTSVANDTIRFSYDGTNWIEISRTIDASKIHTQGTDQKLDDGGANEVTAANAKDAVTKKHTQNSDTALGAQSEDLNMNTHKVVGVTDPAADQDAATKNFVETGAYNARIKAWINFNGTGTIAINDSYNVSSITDNAVGKYTITWDTDFANDDYAVTTSTSGIVGESYASTITYVVGSVDIQTVNSTDNYVDSTIICAIAIGDM